MLLLSSDCYRKLNSNPKATVSVCLYQWYFNDKPADGLQQKRESKPKTLSIETSTSSSPSEKIIALTVMKNHLALGLMNF